MDEPPRLQQLIRRITLDLAAETAAIRMRTAACALIDACGKAGFDPSQPRVPAGSSDGGQWTDAGGDGSAQTDRIRVAEDRDPGFYSVDLEQEDRLRGGHGHKKHVGRSDLSLIAELVSGDHPTAFDARAGTFLSAGDANFYVTQVLRTHPAIVEQVVRGGAPVTIIQRFGFETGREAYRNSEADPIAIRPTYAVAVLIAHDDGRHGRGYRIVTAYPMNDRPDEIFKDK